MEDKTKGNPRPLVLLRHGESEWNKENRFSGWTDIDLSAQGREEGATAGRVLKEHGFSFDVAFTSVLKRAIRTLWLALDGEDPRHPGHDPRYRHLRLEELPATESLKDTVARFLPCWHGLIAPAVRGGQSVLIAGHGNSLRALVKHLDNVSDGDIAELNIPTGIPLVYELDEALHPVRHYYLGDAASVQRAIQAVASQASVKH